MSTSTPKRGQLSFLFDTKKCCLCKKILPISNFSNEKKHKDGKHARCKSCDKKRYAKWRDRNYEKSVIGTIRDRAKRKNVPMEITSEDIKKALPIDMLCPIFGVKMEIGISKRNKNSPSVDRIIPKKGYVPGNIIVVSMKANMIKSDATPDEIIKVGKFYKKLLEEMEDGSETD